MKYTLTVVLAIILTSFVPEKKGGRVKWNNNIRYKVSNKSTGDSYAVTPFSYIILYRILDSSTVVFDSYCMINKKTICKYPEYTTKEKFSKSLIILGKYKELCCRDIKKRFADEFIVVDTSNIYNIYSIKQEQLDSTMNNSYYSIANITASNMDSLDLALDERLAKTEKYKSPVKISVAP